MAGNGVGGSSTASGGGGMAAATITAAAATAIGSAEPRMGPQERNRSVGCFGGLSCFGSRKRGIRIVPASRTPDGNASSSRANGPPSVAISNDNATLNLSILAPPSSPASFTNSALPSTAQSPNCFLSLSANSPGGPSSTMFATGPYAHETQPVSPPVFSTFTTEPSTAPLTPRSPPPELAHITTPSSPDVPYARFLTSSLDISSAGKGNGVSYLPSSYAVGSDLRVTYPLYPGSPSSSLISPASGTPRTGLSSPFPERDIHTEWNSSTSARDSPCSRNGSSKLFGLDSATTRNFIVCPDSSFFYTATSAQFHLDQAQQLFPHGGGRLSVSTEADVYSTGASRHKTCKQDVEEIEAYRASFGFSADDIITTQNYVEISDPLDVSFTIYPFANNKATTELCPITELDNKGIEFTNLSDAMSPKKIVDPFSVGTDCKSTQSTTLPGGKPKCHSDDASPIVPVNPETFGGEERAARVADHQHSERNQLGQSFSDAEIDYRRARSLREANSTLLAWRSSLP